MQKEKLKLAPHERVMLERNINTSNYGYDDREIEKTYLNKILILLNELEKEQWIIQMSGWNFIKAAIKLVKHTEKRLLRMEELIEEVKTIITPEEILGRTPNIYFMYLYDRYEDEKRKLEKFKNKLLYRINITG